MTNPQLKSSTSGRRRPAEDRRPAYPALLGPNHPPKYPKQAGVSLVLTFAAVDLCTTPQPLMPLSSAPRQKPSTRTAELSTEVQQLAFKSGNSSNESGETVWAGIEPSAALIQTGNTRPVYSVNTCFTGPLVNSCMSACYCSSILPPRAVTMS
ncbi:hypothetical protein EDC01DRAFT_462880 [Geopyxis carbonaria]|nr:hypothetical protein EDC01DRAFT_462880 [Geopyxis carbonaria]